MIITKYGSDPSNWPHRDEASHVMSCHLCQAAGTGASLLHRAGARPRSESPDRPGFPRPGRGDRTVRVPDSVPRADLAASDKGYRSSCEFVGRRAGRIGAAGPGRRVRGGGWRARPGAGRGQRGAAGGRGAGGGQVGAAGVRGAVGVGVGVSGGAGVGGGAGDGARLRRPAAAVRAAAGRRGAAARSAAGGDRDGVRGQRRGAAGSILRRPGGAGPAGRGGVGTAAAVRGR